jgi:Ca2+-binding RTX toxin-like protein
MFKAKLPGQGQHAQERNMSVIFTGSPLTGTNNDDYIYDRIGGATTIYGNDGNDIVYGDLGPAFARTNFGIVSHAMPTTAAAALSFDITTYQNGIWTREYNAEIANSTTVSHMSFLVDGTLAGAVGWAAFTVGAGQTLTLDVDHDVDSTTPSSDSRLQIYASDGTSLIFSNNDSSVDFGSESSKDPFLTYTFAVAGTYLVKVSNVFGFNYTPLDSFVLHASLTGQAFSAGVVAGGDAIYGGNGNDTLYGMGGDDFIYGQSGSDLIYGGTGDDSIFGGSAAVDATDDTGNDSIYGEEGADTIYGNGGSDTIYGGAGADFLIGGTGSDNIYGGNSFDDTVDLSDDFMRGGDGQDVLYGNGGNDTLLGGAGFDDLYGGEGNDILYGGAFLVDATDGFDFIYGGNGNDDIRGNGGSDVLYGDAGNDSVIGGLGNDEIYGGLGNDYLRGGDGIDRFYFNTALDVTNNVDTIQAFIFNVDKIVLSRSIFQQVGLELESFEFYIGAAAGNEDHRIIYNNQTGQLFYDADGNGAAGQMQFAVLTNPSGDLFFTDFQTVA